MYMRLNTTKLCYIDLSEVIAFNEIAPTDKFFYVEIIFKNQKRIVVAYDRYDRTLLITDIERIEKYYGENI